MPDRETESAFRILPEKEEGKEYGDIVPLMQDDTDGSN
jgi:hypothetical protein